MLSNRAQRHGMLAPPVADASVRAGTLTRSFGRTAGSNPASARCREVAFNASGYSRAHFLWMFRVRMHADFQLGRASARIRVDAQLRQGGFQRQSLGLARSF